MANSLDFHKLKAFLDNRVSQYNQLEFIDTDPIQIPHKFSLKEDIEIAGFFAATIAWGQRKSIIKNGYLLMKLMDNSPFDFIMNASEIDLKGFKHFVHRTFNGDDCIFFLESLKNIYSNHNGLESVFNKGFDIENNISGALKYFREVFISIPYQPRVKKHISDVASNSAAKRLNMFLRWMVRNDSSGVDFGLWNHIPTSSLMLPLDVHTGNVARSLGLLLRTQNDWKAVEEITSVLRTFDANDPIKYDYALFGIGVFESKKKIENNL